MIVFDLKCAGDHVFEAWFASTRAYDEQRERRLVACPLCGDTQVAKAVMAPNVAPKGNAVARPERIKALLSELAAAQGKALEGSRWVGRRFADEARAMHVGEAEHATIHGQATPEEARALIDEGVPVAPLLLPVAPPETLN
ncbi:DUF1178 family protein [Sphingomonas corticis]|jgi:hypothetical protein|uniref:DUF1178 family protein n=1 Tax=Sphingomonas corticis TaxID=2722791 RepID=A0ABX1CJ62_9SPHN|nr:DUF1178 family protein [Sphingomonas corticis]NJR77191.1 DUF1178 family protein [Sphingomonas corticis]